MNTSNPNINIHRKTVREWLSMPRQWCIPVYQRRYSWKAKVGTKTDKEEYGPTRSFWEAVEKLAKKYFSREQGDNAVHPHYFGALLVEEMGEGANPQLHMYDVVDGQQRLTTISVALMALIGVATKAGNAFKDKFKNEFADYLFAEEFSNPRLWPRNLDREQYENLLSKTYENYQRKKPSSNQTNNESMVAIAYNFFHENFAEFVDNKNAGDITKPLEALRDALLDGFDLAVIPLHPNDEAQLVFEAMNKAALPLTTFDLIRNDILYRVKKVDAEDDLKFFNSALWQQFEQDFWNATYKNPVKHIEEYIARALIAKSPIELNPNNVNQVVNAYKHFFTQQNKDGKSVKEEVEEISQYANTYKHLADLPSGTNEHNLKFGYFKEHHKNVGVLLPAIFVIATCNAEQQEKQRMLNLLESWFIRKGLVSKNPSSHHSQQVPLICEQINRNPNYTAFSKFLRATEFISDVELETELPNAQINTGPSGVINYVFKKIIQHQTPQNRTEYRNLVFEIDHLVPQQWQKNVTWNNALLSETNNDPSIVARKIQTIGNLTPLAKGTNISKSNRSWNPVTEETGARYWLKESSLKMNEKLAEKETWAIRDIDERSKQLAKVICEIWPEDIE